jgi:hypothetical protein
LPARYRRRCRGVRRARPQWPGSRPARQPGERTR